MAKTIFVNFIREGEDSTILPPDRWASVEIPLNGEQPAEKHKVFAIEKILEAGEINNRPTKAYATFDTPNQGKVIPVTYFSLSY